MFLSFYMVMILVPFMLIVLNGMVFLWLFLEISSVMYIMFCWFDEKTLKKDIFLLYFLVQSFSSLVFFISVMMSVTSFKMVSLSGYSWMLSVSLFALLTKVGMPPFHFWVVPMSKMLSWSCFTTLLTWQKLPPMIILAKIMCPVWLPMVCVVSLLLGTLSQFKCSSLKVLMVFSSISHLGWMFYLYLSHSIMVFFYFFIYSMILLSFFLLVRFSSYKSLFDVLGKGATISMLVALFSLGGIPPFLGFILKWVSLVSMLVSTMMCSMFTLLSCLGFYSYIRLVLMSILSSSEKIIVQPMIKFSKFWGINLTLPLILFLL